MGKDKPRSRFKSRQYMRNPFKRFATLSCGCVLPVGIRVEAGQELYCADHKYQIVTAVSADPPAEE